MFYWRKLDIGPDQPVLSLDRSQLPALISKITCEIELKTARRISKAPPLTVSEPCTVYYAIIVGPDCRLGLSTL